MEYTTLSLADVRAGLDAVARDVQAEFGALDASRLNWRPDAAQWSVAQCFDHLVTANQLMFRKMDDAFTGADPHTIWQRVPGLPGLLGRMLIRSQAPTTTRKFTAPASARPSTSDISADIVSRFVRQQREFVVRLGALDERAAARTIMTSPFVKVITYSVLDGWRLVLAHDHRHIQQARRVTQSPGSPS